MWHWPPLEQWLSCASLPHCCLHGHLAKGRRARHPRFKQKQIVAKKKVNISKTKNMFGQLFCNARFVLQLFHLCFATFLSEAFFCNTETFLQRFTFLFEIFFGGPSVITQCYCVHAGFGLFPKGIQSPAPLQKYIFISNKRFRFKHLFLDACFFQAECFFLICFFACGGIFFFRAGTFVG